MRIELKAHEIAHCRGAASFPTIVFGHGVWGSNLTPVRSRSVGATLLCKSFFGTGTLGSNPKPPGSRIAKSDTFSIFACHPCAGAMLIFSVSFQFLRMTPKSSGMLDSRSNICVEEARRRRYGGGGSCSPAAQTAFATFSSILRRRGLRIELKPLRD